MVDLFCIVGVEMAKNTRRAGRSGRKGSGTRRRRQRGGKVSNEAATSLFAAKSMLGNSLSSMRVAGLALRDAGDELEGEAEQPVVRSLGRKLARMEDKTQRMVEVIDAAMGKHATADAAAMIKTITVKSKA